MIDGANLGKLIGELNFCLRNIGCVISKISEEWRQGQDRADVTLSRSTENGDIKREIVCVGCSMNNEYRLLNDIRLNLIYKKQYCPYLFENGEWEKLDACFEEAEARVRLGIKIDSEKAGDKLVTDVVKFCEKLL